MGRLFCKNYTEIVDEHSLKQNAAMIEVGNEGDAFEDWVLLFWREGDSAGGLTIAAKDYILAQQFYKSRANQMHKLKYPDKYKIRIKGAQ